jgi:hypothetical protein
MKRVAISQSNYLPWKGYFDLIHDADVFIFLDDVQYTHRDWRNRNRIKSPHGLQWLTIPVGNADGRTINEVVLPENDWRERHWRALTHTYRRSHFFSQYEPFFREVYASKSFFRLSHLNQFLTVHIAQEFLRSKTKFLRSEDFQIQARKQERLLALLRTVGATTYISGPAAKAYIDPARFVEAGIELVWKDYSGYPEYPQPFPPFEHAVSIVDLLFSTGPDAPWYIWGWRIQSSP